MILTSAVAVIMAVSVQLDAPHVARWAFAGYLAFFAGWAVMRGPNMYTKLIESRDRRRKLKQRRGELESEAAELRRDSRIAKPGDDAADTFR